MNKLLIILLLSVSIFGQKRFPYRSSPVSANVGSYDWSPAQEATIGYLTPGQGLVNSYGTCVIRVTPTGYAHYYVGPSPMNAGNNWIITYTSPGGALKINWIGPRSSPDLTPGASCSAPVSAPANIPGVPTGIGNNLYHWHPGNTGDPHDDYRALFTSLEGSHQIKLWELYCDPTVPANKCNPANSTEAASTNWQWRLIKDFDGSDGYGPFIDWTNAAFCTSGCGGGSPVYTDTSGFKLWITSWDGNKVIMSIRGGSKYEFGTSIYYMNTGLFHVQYLGAGGELPSGSPTPPACTKGNGVIVWKTTSTYTAYQMNGDPTYIPCPGVSSAKYYRSPIPTTRVGVFTDPQSITGTQYVQHGAPWLHGILTPGGAASGPANWGTYPGNPGELNWVGALRKYDARGPQNAGDNYHMPWVTLMHWQDYDYFQGLHISTPFRADRDKWAAITFYEQEYKASRSTRTFGREIILVDISATSSLPGVPTYPSPLTYGTFRRLLQHNSCHICSGGTYDSQGHGAFNLDGSLLFYKSTQNLSSGAGGVSVYMAVIPPDITW